MSDEHPGGSAPTLSEAGRTQSWSRWCFDPQIERVYRRFVLQHPLLSQRSSWGHTHQEMLPNDPAPASPGLAEAIVPGTERTAKLRIVKGGIQQTQPSRRSPAHHRLQPKHSQGPHSELRGAFFHQSKFTSSIPGAPHALPRLPGGLPAQFSNSFSICIFRDGFS